MYNNDVGKRFMK